MKQTCGSSYCACLFLMLIMYETSCMNLKFVGGKLYVSIMYLNPIKAGKSVSNGLVYV